jgi:hypothetical protein
MRKPIQNAPLAAAKAPRAARLPDGKNRMMPADDVTITSGSNSPRVAVSQWLNSVLTGSVSGGLARAVPGGAQTAAISPNPVRTVALSDGTRITFAAARTSQELEPA